MHSGHYTFLISCFRGVSPWDLERGAGRPKHPALAGLQLIPGQCLGPLCCLFLLDVGFVPGLWDAVMSNAQPPSCSLEVLRMEREVTVSGFLGYKLQKISTGTNSKDIDLTIQNLLNKSAQVP